jgi:hypothetical protein
MMQAAENWFAADSIEFSATMSRRRLWADARDGRGVRNARTQRHMRASAIVVRDPGFEGEAEMGFGQRDHPVQTFPADPPITRSQMAFIFGLCGADFNTLTPSARIESSSCLAKIQSRS